MNFQKNVPFPTEKEQRAFSTSDLHFYWKKNIKTAQLSLLSLLSWSQGTHSAFSTCPRSPKHQLFCFSRTVQSTPQHRPNDTQSSTLNLERKPVHITPCVQKYIKKYCWKCVPYSTVVYSEIPWSTSPSWNGWSSQILNQLSGPSCPILFLSFCCHLWEIFKLFYQP